MSAVATTDAEIVQDWESLDDAGDEQEQVASSPPPTEHRAPEAEPTSPDTTVAQTEPPARETPDERATRLAELEAQNAELQRQMAAREWSSEGRYRAEQKKNQLLQEQLQAFQAQNQDEDAKLTRQYQAAIERASAEDNPIGARALQAELRAELLERQVAREKQERERAERERTEIASTTREWQVRQAGEQVRQAAIPSLRTDIAQLAREMELSADDTSDLLAFTVTPDLTYLVGNAPPEVVAQVYYQKLTAAQQRATALRERQVAQNVNKATADGGFVREGGGGGAGPQDLDKAFAESDFEDALALINEGYVPPTKGKRRR